ncbi:MAG: hypothetical protein IJU37_12200, partial [Desulfovibrio sp.]|nr:hypothetical protein [Desulfovibrio sp.]
MYIFKFDNGELHIAPEQFDPDNPDFDILKDVSEVLCVNKVLVKQLKLVAKSKEEREAIRNERSTERSN